MNKVITITDQFIEAMKAAYAVHGKIWIEAGQPIRTFTVDNSLFMKAEIDMDFPSDLVLSDIGKFNNAIAKTKTYVGPGKPIYLAIHERFCTVQSHETNPKYSVNIIYGSKKVVNKPVSVKTIPEPTLSFFVSQPAMNTLIQSISGLDCETIEIETTEDGKIYLRGIPKKEIGIDYTHSKSSASTFNLEVGEVVRPIPNKFILNFPSAPKGFIEKNDAKWNVIEKSGKCMVEINSGVYTYWISASMSRITVRHSSMIFEENSKVSIDDDEDNGSIFKEGTLD